LLNSQHSQAHTQSAIWLYSPTGKVEQQLPPRRNVLAQVCLAGEWRILTVTNMGGSKNGVPHD
jgi:hypothetical protein